ncbi:MAG: hypothetical protein DME46_01240 [Verrucomicrobia bacterium]|nr:MAG: hypothetical protein DME46_01240 [Verrucomicrobiota bacterium]
MRPTPSHETRFPSIYSLTETTKSCDSQTDLLFKPAPRKPLRLETIKNSVFPVTFYRNLDIAVETHGKVSKIQDPE